MKNRYQKKYFRLEGNGVSRSMCLTAWRIGRVCDWAGLFAQFIHTDVIYAYRSGWLTEKWCWEAMKVRIARAFV